MKKSNFNFRKSGIAAASLMSVAAFAQTQQPNIVLFMVDDMGWQDTSEPFWTERTPYNDLCHTPNMERLARQGVKFTSAYACAISSPSRTSLMTGMNAARHRVTNWTLNLNTSTDGADNTLAFSSWNFNGLQPEGTTGINNTLNANNLAQLLKSNGYHTIHIGKAHWGSKDTPGANPQNLGFVENVGGSAAGGLSSYYPVYSSSHYPIPGLEGYNNPTGVNGVYLTEALTLEAIKKLNTRPTEKPFYLYMSHYAVHIPLQIDPRFQNNPKYAGYSGNELAYLTMVEGMDKSLGDLMDYLETNKLTDNTIVIFMSDNGGHHSIGNITVGGKRYNHNYPLRGTKGSVYEGGVREPMIVKWPGVTQADTSVDHPVIIEDFFPSILEMAGVNDYTTVQEMDGVSFVPYFTESSQPIDAEREFYWHYPNSWGESADGVMAYSSIRKGDYKLVYRWHDSSFELYNVKEDIAESNNLLAEDNAENKQLAESLAKSLSDYLRSVDAQRPTIKATGKLVPLPDEVKIPASPVEPEISDANSEHWYKIHDQRSPNNYWVIDGTGMLKITTEAIRNDTTTADKLFKLQLAADGSGYEIYSYTNLEVPVSAANTNNETNLTINAANPINSWIYSPSVVSGYYLIAAEADSRQLNSYADNRKKVSFWMPVDGDTDPGNRWAFIPGFLKGAATDYPTMSRYFTNATAPHEQAQSRYLTSVKTTINGEVSDIIGPDAENPTDWAKFNQPNLTFPDAVVDARNPQIVVSKQISSFDLTCLGSTVNVRNLKWTQQNVFIDWNKDFDFLDANEAGERTSTSTPNDNLVTSPGFTRTIQIPDETVPGTYRMRLIYHEPETATDWKTAIWGSNVIRNGIAYDFDLVVKSATSVNAVVELNNKIQIRNGQIFIDGVSSFELYGIDGKKLNSNSRLVNGVYIVKVKDSCTKVIVK